VHIGRQAIRNFYTAVENASSQADVETLRVLGHEAAFYWTLTIHGMRISIISVMTFEDEAKDRVDEGLLGPGEHFEVIWAR